MQEAAIRWWWRRRRWQQQQQQPEFKHTTNTMDVIHWQYLDKTTRRQPFLPHFLFHLFIMKSKWTRHRRRQPLSSLSFFHSVYYGLHSVFVFFLIFFLCFVLCCCVCVCVCITLLPPWKDEVTFPSLKWCGGSWTNFLQVEKTESLHCRWRRGCFFFFFKLWWGRKEAFQYSS